MEILSRCPLRISFAGGGSDVDAFAHHFGGCVTSAAITRYVTVKASEGGGDFISYPIDETDITYLKKLAISCPGVSLESRLDVPPQSGLGASGALGVAALGGLITLHEESLNRDEIARVAHLAEIAMGTPAGRQDYYPALYGGINEITFSDDGVIVKPLKLSPGVILTLESSLILVFIHPRRGSSLKVMSDEIKRVEKREPEVIEALQKQAQLAKEAAQALLNGRMMDFGEILHESWETKKKQTPLATNEVIDAVYEVSRKAGALGGKLAGAGGGGYLFLFAPGKEGEVAERLRAIGLRPENVSFDFGGLKTWHTKKS